MARLGWARRGKARQGMANKLILNEGERYENLDSQEASNNQGDCGLFGHISKDDL